MSENLKIILKLLGDFNNFINNRSTTFLVWPTGTFQKILELHFRIWKKEYQYLSKEDKLDQWSQYSEMSRTLDLIFRHIEVRTLKERVASPFFQMLNKHVERHKREVVDSRSYAESLFATCSLPLPMAGKGREMDPKKSPAVGFGTLKWSKCRER